MTSWGNPKTKTFERTNLRWATYDETKVQVHRLIWPMAERIMVGLEQAGVPVATVSATPDPLHLGFVLAVPEAHLETVQAMVAPAMFEYADGAFRFTGTPDQATEIGAAITPEPVTVEDIGEAPEPSGLPVPPPFARSVEKNEEAPVATFLQYRFDIPVTGIYDKATRGAVKSFQQRMGLDPSGDLNASTWAGLVPVRPTWMRPGQTGAHVKSIQAAFKAHGFYDGAITGSWGLDLSRALRRFQADYGIHQRLRIGNPEWSALFAADTPQE